MVTDRPIVITAGEPAGIGPELCLALANEDLPASFVIVSDPAMLEARASAVGAEVRIREIDTRDAATARSRPILKFSSSSAMSARRIFSRAATIF